MASGQLTRSSVKLPVACKYMHLLGRSVAPQVVAKFAVQIQWYLPVADYNCYKWPPLCVLTDERIYSKYRVQ